MEPPEPSGWRVTEPGAPATFGPFELPSLGDGELLVEVEYSSLNYKDALALCARAPIARQYPLTCGIDLSGRVIESRDPSVETGTLVVATGFGLGEDRDGGLATHAIVPAGAAVAVPDALGARRAEALGTAGLSAMLAVFALEHEGLEPPTALPVAVSGATGGVGSIAVALLARRGHRVAALTGKATERDFLERLGAAEVLDRAEFSTLPEAPLGRAAFAGAIDVVGGTTLANLVTRIAPGGTVAVLGLAGGAALQTTVYPLILRGVVLHGVNAVRPPRAQLERAWARLSTDLSAELLDELTTEVPLDEASTRATALLEATVRGRTVVRVG